MEYFMFWILIWLTLGCIGGICGWTVDMLFYKKRPGCPILPILIGPISILVAIRCLWWWIQDYRKKKDE